MLPRPYGVRISEAQWLARACRSHEIRHDSICREVSTPNDVTGAGACETGRLVRRGLEERSPIGRCHKFCAAFAARIGIVPAQLIVFAVTPMPFFVLIALVAGDVD